MTNHTTTQDTSKLNGTFLQGYVKCSYADIVKVFGEPTTGDGYKVDAQWLVVFDDGLLASIYNYKDGKNYLGDKGLDVTDITDWHIGGLEPVVVDRINKILAA